jgi:hypothetical protein
MKTKIKLLFLSVLVLMSFLSFSQMEQIKLNPEKIIKFGPYVEYKHGGKENFPSWKENNKILYTKEMWYYTESFYVKRNHLTEGIELNEEIIDISRFEAQRRENEDAIVILPGFKDALVLMPSKDLIYKPEFTKTTK